MSIIVNIIFPNPFRPEPCSSAHCQDMAVIKYELPLVFKSCYAVHIHCKAVMTSDKIVVPEPGKDILHGTALPYAVIGKIYPDFAAFLF